MHAEKDFINISIGITISNWVEDYSLLAITQNHIWCRHRKWASLYVKGKSLTCGLVDGAYY